MNKYQAIKGIGILLTFCSAIYTMQMPPAQQGLPMGIVPEDVVQAASFDKNNVFKVGEIVITSEFRLGKYYFYSVVTGVKERGIYSNIAPMMSIRRRFPPYTFSTSSNSVGKLLASVKLLSGGNDRYYMLDTTTEDIFALESFDSLIQEKANQNKPFILAMGITKSQGQEIIHYFDALSLNTYFAEAFPSSCSSLSKANPINRQFFTAIHYFILSPGEQLFKPIDALKLQSKNIVAL